ncbi:uncharacterized protein B0I36DRAFT_436390 [Microdochium trichocladiopsis]|uniref:Uncharacterized protein n=1 Tax=Microdochium trichocladiopsis TaxID=1682393 RepID=A0A9P9BIH1_9PEZI|nr:uncharacterized protein B0I36DRAFT_436390 [Microdochium trichocladiopsis]KAH7014388.1 hypothetical protein B0I36DRAFT_436390 [Microdochium trichocladiopsis]
MTRAQSSTDNPMPRPCLHSSHTIAPADSHPPGSDSTDNAELKGRSSSAEASTSMPSRADQPGTLLTHQCHRKHECEGNRPRCSQCFRLGQRCEYPTFRQAEPQSQPKPLQDSEASTWATAKIQRLHESSTEEWPPEHLTSHVSPYPAFVPNRQPTRRSAGLASGHEYPFEFSERIAFVNQAREQDKFLYLLRCELEGLDREHIWDIIVEEYAKKYSRKRKATLQMQLNRYLAKSQRALENATATTSDQQNRQQQQNGKRRRPSTGDGGEMQSMQPEDKQSHRKIQKETEIMAASMQQSSVQIDWADEQDHWETEDQMFGEMVVETQSMTSDVYRLEPHIGNYTSPSDMIRHQGQSSGLVLDHLRPYSTQDSSGGIYAERSAPPSRSRPTAESPKTTSPGPNSAFATMDAVRKFPNVTFGTISERPQSNSDTSSDLDSDSASDCDDLFSRYSASTVPTEAEFKVSNLGAIYLNFTDLLFQDKHVTQAILVVLGKEKSFIVKQRIRSMLKGFVDVLQVEIPSEDADMAALFRGRTQIFASEIVRKGHSIALKDESKRGGEASSESDLSEDHTYEEDQDGDQSDDDDGTDRLHTEAIDPIKFLSIVGSSNAFQQLLDQIYDYGFPSLKARLQRLCPRLRRGEPNAERILSEMMYSQPSVLLANTKQPGHTDILKSAVETMTGGAWDWWPLAPVMKSLSEKQVRIEWRCRCGRLRTEVVARRFGKALERVIANAAADLESVPNRTRPNKIMAVQSGGTSTPRQGGTAAPKHRPNRLRQQAWADFGTEQDDKRDEDQDERLAPPAANQHGQMLPATAPRAIFFMVHNSSILPWNVRLRQSVIHTKELCDERFYHNMRWEFWRHRGWLKSLFSLDTFAGCDFYQFKRYGKDKYHEAVEGLPDNIDEYLYLKQELRPQVCWEEFRDGYWNWSNHCDVQQCSTESVVVRIPKKKLDRGSDSGQDKRIDVIWGIVARTERAFYVAAIYIALAASPLIPATWFFFKWLSPPVDGTMDEYQLANHRDNLSNAFVPLGISLALLMTVVTCVFSKFD